ncbi:interleukin-31 receptor subunit alpha isoform X2 [Oryzias melastigma]|uniref:interleukin-31 receptor subunit alpha isoform X2 n=1 Tax=Oryzias melastigma TaxID=30732 RepID=UPI000CF81809|nr:interleukin-31 receptor subunit alpha isoform X2 [Oryzias melastigma]
MIMEGGPVMVLMLLLSFSLVQASALILPASKTSPPQPPRLIRCVFLQRSNVTCFWDPGDVPAKTYTLKVQRTSSGSLPATDNPLTTFTCTTSNTSCTIRIAYLFVRIHYCIRVIAHIEGQNISSEPRCQPGRKEVRLPAVLLTSIQPILESPECLTIGWEYSLSQFPLSKSEIERGHLNSQLELSTQEETVQVRDVNITGLQSQVCLFRPDTSYIIRLRHRYLGPESPWSSWSNPLQGRTAHDAPSTEPVFWRQVKDTDGNGLRLVDLLWEPLPTFVLFYNVTCQTESVQDLSDYGSCVDLKPPNTSCSLYLPVGRCSCSLTATNSAGTSPEARIWLFNSSETKLPPPNQISVKSLTKNSLEVHWVPPLKQRVSGFVVEWFAVREETGSIFWKKLNSSVTKQVITGLKPMERYAVSVKILYEEQVGKNRMQYVYTREGTPSAGPSVKVQHISGSSVELSWTPVPVEELHGFLTNYIILYSTKKEPAKSVVIPHHVQHYRLENLLPGNYIIFMQANTAAGLGPAGNKVNVYIDSREFRIVMKMLIPLLLISLGLILIAGLVPKYIIKQKLLKHIPDPSKSSLSSYAPKTNLEDTKPLMVQEKPENLIISDVILLDIQENVEKNPDYQNICNLQTYLYNQNSSFSLLRNSEEFSRKSTASQTGSDPVPSFFPCIYSSINISQPSHPFSTSIWHSSFSPYKPLTVSVDYFKLPSDGANEASNFNSSLSNQDKNFRLFVEQRQPSMSFSDFCKKYSLSVLPYSSTEVSGYNLMIPPLQANMSLSSTPDGLMPLSTPHLPLVFEDLTFCPVQCDPYIPFEA